MLSLVSCWRILGFVFVAVFAIISAQDIDDGSNYQNSRLKSDLIRLVHSKTYSPLSTVDKRSSWSPKFFMVRFRPRRSEWQQPDAAHYDDTYRPMEKRSESSDPETPGSFGKRLYVARVGKRTRLFAARIGKRSD